MDTRQAVQLVEKLRERVLRRTQARDELSEDDVWQRHGTVVWQAGKFVGRPTFYPVYRTGNYYSIPSSH